MSTGTRVTIAVSLTLLLGASAIAQVRVQHERRLQFVALRALERERDALEEQWGQLELEQSAWVGHDRIDKQARKVIGLSKPSVESIVLVKP